MTASKRQIDEGVNGDIESKKHRISGTEEQNNSNLEDVYLSTIDRKKLDFDFEKVCSVTLSNLNIYGCLVCGKYFQGRGKSSPAFLHSIGEDHHVFITFDTLKVYTLPDNKPIESSSLNDIKYSICPTYTKEEIKKLNSLECLDLNGNSFKPGFIGLNNIKANDYMNVVLQAISHTQIVQQRLLLVNDKEDDEIFYKNELNKRFTIFVKKLWSSKLFKNHISPHEVLQHVGVLSNKKFTINEKKNPKDFLLWFLNSLHRSLLIDKSSKTIISHSFQGKLKITSQKISLEESTDQKLQFKHEESIKATSTKFWILSFDLPSSFFLNANNIDKIPQVKLSTLLEKYTSDKEHVLPNEIRKYSIEKFPPYLIFHFNRFKDSKLDIDLSNKERNQTIIEFPLEICFRKETVKYRLVSNIAHQSVQSSTDLKEDYQSDWLIQLKRNDDWFEIQNLDIKSKEKELLFLSESYIQFWERIQ